MGRPTGVTVVAVLYFVFAGLCVLAGIGLMVGAGFIATMMSQQQGVPAGLLGAIGAGLGVFCLFFAALDVLLGWGMLKLKNWARIVTIVLAALVAVGALFGLFAGLAHFLVIGMVVELCRLAISGWIIWYLLQPHVRAAFEGVQVRAAGA